MMKPYSSKMFLLPNVKQGMEAKYGITLDNQEKFSKIVTQILLPFFVEVAERVVEQLGLYVKHFWSQIKVTQHALGLNNLSEESSSGICILAEVNDVMNIIGEFLFDFECLKILGAPPVGDSPLC